MYFGTKSYLKNTRNHTAKHALKETVSSPTGEIWRGNLWSTIQYLAQSISSEFMQSFSVKSRSSYINPKSCSKNLISRWDSSYIETRWSDIIWKEIDMKTITHLRVLVWKLADKKKENHVSTGSW
jgi:hypothetical protein